MVQVLVQQRAVRPKRTLVACDDWELPEIIRTFLSLRRLCNVLLEIN